MASDSTETGKLHEITFKRKRHNATNSLDLPKKTKFKVELSEIGEMVADETLSDMRKNFQMKKKIHPFANLNANKTFSEEMNIPGVDQIESMQLALSIEKIESIKLKRLTNKKRSMDRDAFYKEILSYESVEKNRNNYLSSKTKNFAKIIFPMNIFGEIKKEEEKIKRLPPPTTYSRYEQEKFTSKKSAEGFKIETMGTYQSSTFNTITDKTKPTKRVCGPFKKSINTPRVDSLQPNNVPQKRVSRTPIIIIPAAPTSLITMLNVKDLLENLAFVSNDEKKAKGAKHENEVAILRKKDGSNFTNLYKIVDSINRLEPNDWERVVAVFVHGPTWQFKGWPWNGYPVEIFSRIKAFHLKFDDEKMNENVAKWDVYPIELSKYLRHQDRAKFFGFWTILHKFMEKNKPNLRC